MVVPAHISVITLGVADVSVATAFYESLGWLKLNASEEAISFFQLGGVVLGVFGWHALAEDACVDNGAGQQDAVVPGAFRGVSIAINVHSPDRVDEVVDAWVHAGGTLVKQPQSVFWGGYSGYVSDLDGHLWEIAFNPYSPEWAAPEH